MSDISEPVADAPVADAPVADVPVDVPEATYDAPVADAPVEDAPVADAPVEDAPPADPFEEFGGREYVERAKRMYDQASTEDGIIQLFVEAGGALGLGLKEIQSLFEGSAPEPEDQPDPDEPITRAEFEAELARRQAAQQQTEQQKQVAAAQKVVVSSVESLGLKMDDPATKTILDMGDKYLPTGSTDPEAIANAVRRGHADFQALVEKEAQAYVAKKSAAAQSVPSAPAGSAAPAVPPPAEPRDVAEAIKIARRKMRGG